MWTESRGENKGKRCTSHSELSIYATCQAKHYKQYVLRNKKGSPHFAFGNALDAVLEYRVNCKIKGVEPDNAERCKSMWEGVYRTAIDKLKKEEMFGFDVEKMLQVGFKHVDLFINEIEPTLKPLSAQKRIYWPLYGDLFVRMDLDYVDKRNFFIDWKTMASAPNINWVNRKKEAFNQGLMSDDDKAWKDQYNKEHSTDTFIDPKYLQQILIYAQGLHHIGLDYHKAFIVGFTKKGTPRIVKQKIIIDDLEKNGQEVWNLLAPLAMGVERNYNPQGEAPVKNGLYLPSAYGGGICDSCDVRDIDDGLCGKCRAL